MPKFECIKEYQGIKKGDLVEIYNLEVYQEINGYVYVDLDCDFIIVENKNFELVTELENKDFLNCFKSTEKSRKQFIESKPKEILVLCKKNFDDEFEKYDYVYVYFCEDYHKKYFSIDIDERTIYFDLVSFFEYFEII